ncbi:MRN complex-interacting protein [Eleutherodactylus coqui]|uniref:MRN complex-interacting protein n=1 Tax=Eleutherodactylus coqui TaxID=57060 RepID=UPI0034629E8E
MVAAGVAACCVLSSVLYVQVRSSRRWTCKLCGDKQSQLKEERREEAFGRSNFHQAEKQWRFEDQEEVRSSRRWTCKLCGDKQSQLKVRSSRRWTCKLCGDKQSQLKVYGQSSAADCRRHVQKLNLLQGQVERAAADRAGKLEPFPSYGGDFYEVDIEENVSKKKKIYEGGNQLETIQSSSRITEDIGCLKWHDKHQSQTLSLQSASDTCPPMNTWERHFKQSTYNTTSFLKRDAIFNNFYHKKKIGAECSVTSTQDLPNDDEPPTASRLSAQMISPPVRNPSSLGGADQESDSIVKTSSSFSLQKPVIQSRLFQTDDDFDDDY